MAAETIALTAAAWCERSLRRKRLCASMVLHRWRNIAISQVTEPGYRFGVTCVIAGS
jgi:hypothetical protein